MSFENSLDRLNVTDLRALAAELKIAGRSKMKRAELVAAITEAEASKADAEAGELLDAALGENEHRSVNVHVNRYTEGRATVTMQGHAFGDMSREAYRIGRRWELVDQEHGVVFLTVRARSLEKVVKRWAKMLNTRADRIDVARSF